MSHRKKFSKIKGLKIAPEFTAYLEKKNQEEAEPLWLYYTFVSKKSIGISILGEYILRILFIAQELLQLCKQQQQQKVTLFANFYCLLLRALKQCFNTHQKIWIVYYSQQKSTLKCNICSKIAQNSQYIISAVMFQNGTKRLFFLISWYLTIEASFSS